jgi:hypothetical protein
LVEKRPWEAGKNGGYAQSLKRMASYVGSLPDDDPTLRALAACPDLYCPYSEMFTLPIRQDGGMTGHDADAIHCGPRGGVIGDAEVPGWFSSWAEAVLEEATLMATEKAREAEAD